MDERTPGSIIFSKIDFDPYLIEIYENILYNYSVKLFGLNREAKPVNIDDALRFADLLSKSTHPKNADKHRILSQEIVALLKYIYPKDHSITHYLGSILTNTGNYLGKSHEAPTYKSKNLLDRAFCEFAEDFMAIPAEPQSKFLHSQKFIYDRLASGNLSYSAPTSMGKSFIMRMFIKRRLIDNAKMNFSLIVPTKALINEVSQKISREDLKELLAEKNYKIVTAPGSIFLKGNHNFIFVMTPERLLYLLISNPKIRLDYLFIDEAHKISSSDARSAFYYKSTEMLMRDNKATPTIFASPNIPNPDVYLKLLSPQISNPIAIASKFSPVSQIKYFIDFPSKKVHIYNSTTKELSLFTTIKANTTIDKILKHIGANHKNIVYCRSKSKAIEMARTFAEGLPDIVGDKELTRLATDVGNEIHGDCYLAKLLKKGVAYHVGFLPASIRMRIEEMYKAKDSNLTTLFCTSTLVEGVNLPADNLFITSYYNGSSPMSKVDFANLSGRVGRIEFNLYGNVFLTRMQDNDQNQVDEFIDLLKCKVPQQQLSIVTELSPTQKQKIVDCLKTGSMELLKYPKDQTAESYELMRKFAIILVRDIVAKRSTVVKRAFEEFLTDGVEEQIRLAFEPKAKSIDDDINISVDQTESLHDAIKNDNLHYPELDTTGYIPHADLLVFLKRLCKIFKWDIYERATLGKLCKPFAEHKKCDEAYVCQYCRLKEPRKQLSFYAVVLGKWLQGHGLSYIIKDAISHCEDHPVEAIMLPDHTFVDYDGSIEHKNIIIAETLDVVENVILFRMSNYFLKFSTEYKLIHGADSLPKDWYEYVEYGTTNQWSIFFQSNEIKRETANYIKEHGYCVLDDTGTYRIKKSIFQCGEQSILNELEVHKYNVPELFIE